MLCNTKLCVNQYCVTFSFPGGLLRKCVGQWQSCSCEN